MAKRAVIDTGDTMVAMIVDILEQLETHTPGEVEVGDRVRVLSGLYEGVEGEVKLLIAGDSEPMIGPKVDLPKRESA